MIKASDFITRVQGVKAKAGYIVKDSQSSSALYFFNLSDSSVIPLSDVYIPDTGVAEPQYHGSSGGAAPTNSMDFYKCSAVYSDSTWSGYKAVLNQDGYYEFQSESTEGLVYTEVVPVTNNIYSADALITVADMFSGLTPSNYISFMGSAIDSITGDVGTVTGNVTSHNSYYDFNGYNTKVNFDPTKLTVAGLTQFTLLIDLYAREDSGVHDIFYILTSGYTKLAIEASGGKIDVAWRDIDSGDTGPIRKVYDSTSYTTNTWISYAVVFNSPNVTMYRNATQVGSGSNFSSMSNSNVAAYFGGDYINANIRNFRLFKQVLTPAQIARYVTA